MPLDKSRKSYDLNNGSGREQRNVKQMGEYLQKARDALTEDGRACAPLSHFSSTPQICSLLRSFGSLLKMSTLMWSCPCCLRFKFTPEELEQRYKSQEIDKMIEKDKQAMKRQVKLLLLGAGESGKSTFLKQMRIIHGINFESHLIKEYQQVIYQNVVKGLKVLVDARDKLAIPWGDTTNSELGKELLTVDNSVVYDSRLFNKLCPLISRLWQDSGIRRAFERRREFQLVSTVIYLQFSQL